MSILEKTRRDHSTGDIPPAPIRNRSRKPDFYAVYVSRAPAYNEKMITPLLKKFFCQAVGADAEPERRNDLQANAAVAMTKAMCQQGWLAAGTYTKEVAETKVAEVKEYVRIFGGGGRGDILVKCGRAPV